MSSYFDYFCKNINTNNEACNDTIKGTCNSMCPENEITLREKEDLVHVLEVSGPEKKLVKCYSRSAADSNIAIPVLLRPYNILKDTVDYLLLEVTRRYDVPITTIYDFVNDRLRAVRQDMTIQRLPPEQCVNLLEPMVRFYVYFGYKLCELPLKDYDPVLNKKYLLECIKWFLSCCESQQRSENNGKINEISSFLSNLVINKNDRYVKKLVCDRGLMESLYILCNLDDVHPLFRYVKLPKDVKRRALQVMSHSYNSKQLSVPTEVLRRWLRFPSDVDVATVCNYYGIQAKGATVRFCKADFKTDVAMHQPRKLLLHEKTLNLDLENIFTYSTQN